MSSATTIKPDYEIRRLEFINFLKPGNKIIKIEILVWIIHGIIRIILTILKLASCWIFLLKIYIIFIGIFVKKIFFISLTWNLLIFSDPLHLETLTAPVIIYDKGTFIRCDNFLFVSFTYFSRIKIIIKKTISVANLFSYILNVIFHTGGNWLLS